MFEKNFDQVIGPSPTEVLGIQQAAQKGIAGRGILLDFAGWASSVNITYSAFSGFGINSTHLDAVAAWQGLPQNWSKPGDILLPRLVIAVEGGFRDVVGLALAGYTAVCDLGLSAFIPLVADEMLYKAGRWRYMHNLKQPLHLVYLSASGLASHGAGPEHSDSGGRS